MANMRLNSINVVIKKTFLIVILFVLSLAVFLVATMPAAVLWKQVLEPNLPLRANQLQVKSLSGSVWDGRALVMVQRVPAVIDWQLEAVDLLGLSIPLAVKINTDFAELEARASVGPTTVNLTIDRADIALAGLNKQLVRQRVKLDGDLFAKGIELELIDQKLSQVSGRFSWSGGTIAYPVGRQQHERVMPSFVGSLQTNAEGVMSLQIRDEEGSVDSIVGELLPDGLAQLQVRRRLLDLADEPWSANSTEQDTVFKVKKNLYQ